MTTEHIPQSGPGAEPDDIEHSLYNNAQMLDYFKRIGLPREQMNSPLLLDQAHAKRREHALPFLQSLMRHHISAVPFENLELHYSTRKVITLKPQQLFHKFVIQKRGGRCMENNSFFGTALRSLGYEVRNCGGRVARAMSPVPEIRHTQGHTYDGWNHMLNLARLDDEWYVVDVGMGAMGPSVPYPLRDGYEANSIAPRKLRLQLRAIAESSGNGAQRPQLWCYDVCNRPGTDNVDVWIPTYCFTEIEFLPQDYEVMSWYTSYNKRSFFTTSLMTTIMLMDDAREHIIGNITLFQSTIRKTVAGKRTVMKECRTEKERVTALREIFGITLSEQQQNGIEQNLKLE